MSDIWTVPQSWLGERCYIIGGGPSAEIVSIPKLRQQLYDTGKIIAVNDAFLMVPQADVLYFGDIKWFDDNCLDIDKYTGRDWHNRNIVTRVFVKPEWHGFTNRKMPFRRLARQMAIPLSRHPSALAGWCSGSNAINLAYLFGATEIILIGFDMQGGNWHNRHKREKKPDCYNVDFIPYITRMAAELNCECKVINASMDSALNCFEKKPLAEVLGY